MLPDIRSSGKIKASIHGSVLWVKTRTRPGLFKKNTVEDLVKLKPSVELKPGRVFSK